MKTTNLIFILIPIFLLSQEFKIEYKSNIEPNQENIEKLLEGVAGDKREVQKQLISEITKKRLYNLYVFDSISYFIELPVINNSQSKNKVNFGNNVGHYYIKNTLSKTSNEQITIDKKYNVKDTLLLFEWEIKDSLKNICSNKVQKAIALNPSDSTQITAWFSKDLKNNTGPEKYWGLPGTIISLRVDFFGHDSVMDSFTFNCVKISNITDKEKKKIIRNTKNIKNNFKRRIC